MSELITMDTGEQLDVAAYPLPDGINDTTFNLDDLATAMNVSNPTISQWISKGMPVHKQGGKGQSYEFILSHCYAWRKWREDRDAAERHAKTSQAQQMALMFLNLDQSDDRDGLLADPKKYKEHIEAEMLRNRAAEQRGELVRSALMQDMVDQMLVGFRNSIVGFPDWLEQEFGLSPAQVAKTQDACDEILQELSDQLRAQSFRPAQVLPIADGPKPDVKAT